MSYTQEIVRTMTTELNRIMTCLDALTEEQIWQRLKPNMNSIGNLCVHLAGNEYQHFVSGIGKKPNIRQRTVEFMMDRLYTKDELKELLVSTRQESLRVLNGLTEEDMEQPVRITYDEEDWKRMAERSPEEAADPGYTRELRVILFQVCEHFGYHTGQIVLLTKLLMVEDNALSGYKH